VPSQSDRFRDNLAESMGKERESAHGSNTRDIPGRLRSRLGCHPIWQASDWTDNYVDTRDVGPLFSAAGLDGTKLFLQNAYNIDVTPNQRVTIILMNVATIGPTGSMVCQSTPLLVVPLLRRATQSTAPAAWAIRFPRKMVTH